MRSSFIASRAFPGARRSWRLLAAFGKRRACPLNVSRSSSLDKRGRWLLHVVGSGGARFQGWRPLTSLCTTSSASVRTCYSDHPQMPPHRPPRSPAPAPESAGPVLTRDGQRSTGLALDRPSIGAKMSTARPSTAGRSWTPCTPPSTDHRGRWEKGSRPRAPVDRENGKAPSDFGKRLIKSPKLYLGDSGLWRGGRF